MTYLDAVAGQIAQNVPADVRPDGDVQSLFRLYAVLALAKGEATTAEDVHDAWAAWMQEVNPEHLSLRPFAELDSETRAADEPYVAAIRAAARMSVAGR